jgi:lysophospholipase L1-like esterase
VRRPAATAALFAAALLVALGIVEGLLRVLPPRAGELRGLHEPRPDKPWLYGARPNAQARLAGALDVRYAINADGFRGPRVARPKPPGTFRIVVLGDSVAFGYGVAEPDAFPRVLERALAPRATRPIEVANLSVSGYNPYTEAALFADVGASYEPDLVLVQFCVNDLADPTLHFDASTLLGVGAIPDAAFPDPPARRAPPHAPSRLALACRRLRTCALLADALAAAMERRPGSGELAAALRSSDPASPTQLAWLRARYAEILAAAWPVPLVVAAFPYATELAPGAPARLQAQLVALGDDAGWTTVDLLPAFRRAAEAGGAPLFLDVWHPSRAGHRVAGEALAAQLSCRGLVPVPADGPDCGP